MALIEVKVRPIANSDKNDKSLKGASRIYVSKDNLYKLTGTALENGKPCVVEKTLADGQIIRREASLWVAPTNLTLAVAQMSKPFQDACGFKLEDKVRITYTEGSTIPDAEDVVLEDVTPNEAAILDEDRPHWEWVVKNHLMGLDHIFSGLTLKRIFAGHVYRTFNVKSVNKSDTTNARFGPKTTKLHIRAANDDLIDGSESAASPARPVHLKLDPIQGLEPQIQELNNRLQEWSRPLRFAASPRSCGLAIHGGHGTGKTLLLNHICNTNWGEAHKIQPSDKLQTINDTLQRAKEHQPSIVVMDRFDKLIDKERSNSAAVIRDIGDFLDRLVDEEVAKNERPKVLIVVACLDFMELPSDLTEMGRFNTHIHLPLPDGPRRKAVLSTRGLPLPSESRDDILTRLAERTHAYNGTDLVKLAAEACRMLEDDIYRLENAGNPVTAEDQYLSEEHIQQAFDKIRPSAMHDVNLKPPPVHWDDIGGQTEVKESLQEAIRLATIPKDELKTYTQELPNGFLLYGPPGCSKTMAAQALATEADLNFFAVKGAELLNMYVGESERQIRQLFQRARDAAPSIIFFDEIDSIGGQRSGFGGGGASSSGGGSGLNVLTTLLNEMQGFEKTKGVLVLAATNRPQALDPALLRPGRFDKIIYVKPPDEAARAAIFRKFVATRFVAADVDVEELARNTAGFSGAEVAKICSAAGLDAWRRDTAVDESQRAGILLKDFQDAMNNTSRMITQDMLSGYEVWANSFLKGATITLPWRNDRQ